MSIAAAPRLDPQLCVRPAGRADLPAMLVLLDLYRGTLLPVAPVDLLRRLGEFLVVEEAGQVLAMGALRPMGPGLAEVRTLAVSPEQRGRGLGGTLVEALRKEAAARGFRHLFALTKEVRFFERCGFRTVPIERFPQKIRLDCSRCPKRACCDETAMLLEGP